MRPLGLVEFATTTDIPNAATITSASLADRFTQDDYFNGWFVTIVIDSDGGTPANGLGTTSRTVTDYVASTGALTVAAVSANLTAEDEDVDCDLYIFHADDIQRAYNRARQIVYPQIALVRDIETLVTGDRQVRYTVPSTIRRLDRLELGQRYDASSIEENVFANPQFDDWASATSPDNWTIAGSGASVNQEDGNTSDAPNYAVLTGQYSARIVVPSSTLTTLLQTVTPDVATEGMECNVSGWVYCTTASRVSIRIAGNDGTAHSGTGWEFIKHSQNLGATATNVAGGIVASSGAAIPVFVDNMSMVIGQSEALEKPYRPILNYEYVPPAAGASDGGIIYFHEILPAKHRIRLMGRDLLSSVSADTDTIEIDGDLLEPLYNKTRELLCEERFHDTDEAEWRNKMLMYRALYDTAVQNGLGPRYPRPLMKIPSEAY